MYTSNNQRLRSAATMIEGQNAFVPALCFAKVPCDRWSKSPVIKFT